MTDPAAAEYPVRAAALRLVDAFGSRNPKVYGTALDEAMASPDLRHIVSNLVGTAFGSLLILSGRDLDATRDAVKRELADAEDLGAL
jgi:hypothetical protein